MHRRFPCDHNGAAKVRAMQNTKSTFIRSTDQSDNEAIGLVDGLVPIPIGIAQRVQVDPSDIALAELTLAMANNLHAERRHREAFLWAVRAARELFEAVGTQREMLEPFKHLFDALGDLNRGVVDPALAVAIENRPGEPSSEWKARACLAGVLDVRMKLGEKEDAAAEHIRKLVTVIPGKSTAERAAAKKRLISWRKHLRSSNPHPSGMVLYKTVLDRIDAIDANQTGLNRAQALAEIEDKLLSWAAEFRLRLSKEGG